MEPSYHDEGEEYAATPLEPDATPGQSPDLAAAGLIPADDDEFERQLHEAISAKAQTVEPAAAQILRPLSHDRIKAALEAENWTFSVDSDGDIGGLWDSNIFYFFTYGEQKEILQIRGRWHQDLPIDLRPQVREALDEWHFAKIWPKGYTTVDDSGRVWVLAEHSVDWEHGVTDEQLRLTMRCGITTSLSLFNKLHERFVTLSPKDLGPD